MDTPPPAPTASWPPTRIPGFDSTLRPDTTALVVIDMQTALRLGYVDRMG
jgi:hypothetical protein